MAWSRIRPDCIRLAALGLCFDAQSFDEPVAAPSECGLAESSYVMMQEASGEMESLDEDLMRRCGACRTVFRDRDEAAQPEP
ncbi:protein of unknown function [Methylorubrum extorquens]|uniref:Uncharacterized protein n=1 Tax=Methylorubrum extorquens TaxID=408 RepID=A0A2N9AW57_METEX|nr:protein of unknown function [Methylorubrum extorquens]